MKNDDLERELRSRRGPRETGYTPAILPMTLDEPPVPASGSSSVGRAAMFAGVAVAGALAVALVAGVLSGPGPDVGSGSEPPSAEASTPSLGDCARMDVKLTAEPWGGAAGSRGTVVTFSLADGRYPCALGGNVAALIEDATGTLLVSGQTASAEPVALTATAAYSVGVTWSNWCADPPATPVTLSVKVAGWPSAVEVPVPGGPDTTAPCSGAELPTSLSVTNLQPARY